MKNHLIVLDDLVIIIVFFLYYIFWRYKSDKIAKKVDSKNFTISDYSIYVSNLPK